MVAELQSACACASGECVNKNASLKYHMTNGRLWLSLEIPHAVFNYQNILN